MLLSDFLLGGIELIVKLYNTEDSTNTINKTIDYVEDIDVKFKDEVNIYNPLIILKSNNLIEFNFIFIEKFNRYYFVENVEVFPNKIYHITLRCDVLMSFKDDILGSYGNITNQTNYNEYYNFDYSSEVRKEVEIFKSNVILEHEETTILVTLGG